MGSSLLQTDNAGRHCEGWVILGFSANPVLSQSLQDLWSGQENHASSGPKNG